MELKERTNHPPQKNPVRYPYEIFRARDRQNDIPPVHPSRYELDGIVDRGSREVVGEGFDFYSNFGKPGGGAPVGNQTKRTLMLNERFDTKMKDHHWIHSM